MGQYFDNDRLKSKISVLDFNVFSSKFSFNTDNGVFSKKRLDFGTKVLLSYLPINEIKGNVLDVGCGYGPISIVLGKVASVNIDGVDINKRALHLANMNAKKNKVDCARFFESDCYSAVFDSYDFIITNPPIRAGKKVVYEIIMGAKNHLNSDGVLFFVIRKDHGMKSLLKDMENTYNTSIIGKENGFFVIKASLR